MSDHDILLVEDDEVFARVISRAMAHRHYTLHHAPGAGAVPAMLNRQQFDWAILDLNLGGHSSLSLIPVLKQHNPDITILVLTGYASIATAVEAIKLGASNYLAKPADADEILAALQTRTSITAAAPEPEIQGRMSVRRLEWEHIQQVLKENNGNISETARQLGMHRRTLQRKLQKRPVSR
jgi:two-component system response regulator RegA